MKFQVDQAAGEAAGRVLIIAPQPFYADRGTPIAVGHCAQALVQLGYRVDVATFPVGRDPDIHGVKCFRCANPFRFRHVPIGFSLKKLVLDVPLTATAARMLRRHRYDFIHAVEEAAFPAVILGAWSGVPVIYDMQSSLPQQLARSRVFGLRPVRAFLDACERWLIRRCDAIACSAGLAPRVREIAPDANVLEWQFPSLDSAYADGDGSELRASLGIRADAPVVLYAGTFEPYQGLDTLMQAMPSVQEELPGAVLVLVGADGQGRQRIDGSDRLNGGLRVVPRQPRGSMSRYLAMANVLVSPRRYGDNVPLKVFDYLAAGRPIVATDIPSHRAVLDDTVSLLVPSSPPEMGKAISRVLQDRELSNRLSESARDLASDSATWNSFVDRVDRLAQLAAARA